MVVREPFTQLWSLHAFVRSGDDTKQVPLLFIVVSRRRAKDYKAVFRAVLDMLPGKAAVHEIVMDFERAVWKAAATVLPNVRRPGCAFHWGQAVWRKVQGLGLQQQFMQDDATYKYVRKLLVLPLLPAEHIIVGSIMKVP